MVSIDLKDAYLQIPIHLESRRFLRFGFRDQVVQFRVLPFGLTTAPQVFTRVMAPVSAFLHRLGYRMMRYLDDWLVLGSSREEVIRARDALLILCQRLGIRVNLQKSQLSPTQCGSYLGMIIQTLPLRAFPTADRLWTFLAQLEEFRSAQEQPQPSG